MLEDVRPTLRNKPSGLKADWLKTTLKRTVPHRQVSTHTQSSSSSTLLSSPMIPQSPPPELELDHMSSLLAVSPPPIFSKSSSPPSFHGNIVPLIDAKARVAHQEHDQLPAVCGIPTLLLHPFSDRFP